MAGAFASGTTFAGRLLASATAAAAVCLAAAVLCPQSTGAQSREAAEPTLASCDQFLPPRQQVGDKRVGPDKCLVISDDIVFDLKGRPFRRLELRISGTVAGFAVKQGPRVGYFNDAPDLVFTQSGNDGPRFAGIGRYEGATGHGMSLFLPLNAADWNGKLFITAHGAGPYGGVGTLIPRYAEADFNPLTNLNRYVGMMIDRGYAVAHTLRSSHIVGGDVVVTLDDGTVLPKNNVSSHAGFIVGFTATAENIVRQRLGRDSQRRYFYGFSAGSMMGRHVQYLPGANKGLDGRRLFDGFLLDDAGGGMWLPVLKVDGKDVLFGGRDAERFLPQIDITHALYLGDTGDFLKFKRENARLLAQKGLGDRHRMYEIRGVSHFDAGQTSLPDLDCIFLDVDSLNHELDDPGLLDWEEFVPERVQLFYAVTHPRLGDCVDLRSGFPPVRTMISGARRIARSWSMTVRSTSLPVGRSPASAITTAKTTCCGTTPPAARSPNGSRPAPASPPTPSSIQPSQPTGPSSEIPPTHTPDRAASAARWSGRDPQFGECQQQPIGAIRTRMASHFGQISTLSAAAMRCRCRRWVILVGAATSATSPLHF
jgi:hypothetical protein